MSESINLLHLHIADRRVPTISARDIRRAKKYAADVIVRTNLSRAGQNPNYSRGICE